MHTSSTPAGTSSAAYVRVRDASGLEVTLPASLLGTSAAAGSSSGGSSASNPPPADSAAARVVAALSSYEHQVFVYGRAWDVILRALAITSECVLAHCFAADFWIAKNEIANAIRSLQAAQSLLPAQEPHLTQRERLYVRGYALMLEGQLRPALHTFLSVLDDAGDGSGGRSGSSSGGGGGGSAPSDLFAVKKCQLLAFLLGDRRAMLQVVQRPQVHQAQCDRKYFQAVKAFALEEMEQYEEASAAVDRALQIEPHDVWALHVKAHLLSACPSPSPSAATAGAATSTGDASGSDGGGSGSQGANASPSARAASWLEGHAAEWAECMSFMYVHCWFHTALLRLDADQYEEALHIFDTHVWPHQQPQQQQQQQQPPSPASPAAPSLSDSDLDALLLSPAESSFGVPLTSLSFKRQDASCIEDQNGALNLLWRMEMRLVGAGKMPLHQHQQQQQSGASLPPSQLLQQLQQSNAIFPLHSSALSARWKSVLAHVQLPPSQALSLWGLLQLYALARTGRMREARETLQQLVEDTEKMTDETRKKTLQGVLLPVAESIIVYHSPPAQGGGARAAFDRMARVFAPARDDSSLSSGGSSGSSSAASASAPALPPLADRLAVLSASGEQLDVLWEWYAALCAASGEWGALRAALAPKRAARAAVAWYARMEQLATTAMEGAATVSDGQTAKQ